MSSQFKIWMSQRFKPAVPRRYVFALAGGLWVFAGILLCFRAAVWFGVFSVGAEVALELISVVLAIASYSLVFSKLVKKNIDRINGLPERACLFAFTHWRGYLMIVLMMTLGLTLRSINIPTYLLSVPYTAMGVTLLIGSIGFFRQFRLEMRREG